MSYDKAGDNLFDHLVKESGCAADTARIDYKDFNKEAIEEALSKAIDEYEGVGEER